MRGIRVVVEKQEYPEKYDIRYINHVKTLAVTRENERHWEYGVALSGDLLLETNRDKELVNVELMLGKKMWKRCRIETVFRSSGACRLFLPEIDRSSDLETMPVLTRFDTEKHCLQILLRETIAESQCFRLSKGCDVLVQEGFLVGFQFKPSTGMPYLYEMLQ